MPDSPEVPHPAARFSKLAPDRFLQILATFEGDLDRMAPARTALIVEEREWELLVAYEAHQAATASRPPLPPRIAVEEILEYLPVGLRTDAVMHLVLQDVRRMEAPDEQGADGNNADGRNPG